MYRSREHILRFRRHDQDIRVASRGMTASRACGISRVTGINSQSVESRQARKAMHFIVKPFNSLPCTTSPIYPSEQTNQENCTSYPYP